MVLNQFVHAGTEPLPGLSRACGSPQLCDEKCDPHVLLDGNGELLEVLLRRTFPEQRAPLLAHGLYPFGYGIEAGVWPTGSGDPWEGRKREAALGAVTLRRARPLESID